MSSVDLVKVNNDLMKAKGNLAPCAKDQAIEFASNLVGGYPDLKVQDPDMFIRHLVALMVEYPADVCDLTWKQIPRAIPKYKLDIAGIRAWLEERMHERRAVYAEAVRRREEAEKAAKDAAHDERVAADKAKFAEWLKDHPGGNYRQFLGLMPYPAPTVEKPEHEAWEVGPWQAASDALKGVA